MKLGFKLTKKTIAFFTVVPILAAVSLIQMPCPICNGTGEVNVSADMENVHIMQVTGNQITAVQNICEMFTLFQYDLTIRLTNTSIEDVDGWLKLILRDYSLGEMLDRQYVTVKVPAEATVDVNYKVWFRTGLDVPQSIEAHAEQVIENITDDVCDGTGKLPFNMWLLVNNLKGHLKEISQEGQDFVPPAPFFPDEGGSWSE